jgi:hypothetical protein
MSGKPTVATVPPNCVARLKAMVNSKESVLDRQNKINTLIGHG